MAYMLVRALDFNIGPEMVKVNPDLSKMELQLMRFSIYVLMKNSTALNQNRNN
jgi:hypothetical protein